MESHLALYAFRAWGQDSGRGPGVVDDSCVGPDGGFGPSASSPLLPGLPHGSTGDRPVAMVSDAASLCVCPARFRPRVRQGRRQRAHGVELP